MKTMVVLDESLIRALLDAVDFQATDGGEPTEGGKLLAEAVRQLQVGLEVLVQARKEAKS